MTEHFRISGKGWSEDQQPQQCLGSNLKCKISGPIPDLVNRELFPVLTKPPGDSDASSRQTTSDLHCKEARSFLKQIFFSSPFAHLNRFSPLTSRGTTALLSLTEADRSSLHHKCHFPRIVFKNAIYEIQNQWSTLYSSLSCELSGRHLSCRPLFPSAPLVPKKK